MKTHRRHGQGTLVYKNGDTYTGNWITDRIGNGGAVKYAHGCEFKVRGSLNMIVIGFISLGLDRVDSVIAAI